MRHSCGTPAGIYIVCYLVHMYTMWILMYCGFVCTIGLTCSRFYMHHLSPVNYGREPTFLFRSNFHMPVPCQWNSGKS